MPVLEQSSGRLYRGAGIAQGPNFLFSRQEGPNLYMSKASADVRDRRPCPEDRLQPSFRRQPEREPDDRFGGQLSVQQRHSEPDHAVRHTECAAQPPDAKAPSSPRTSGRSTRLTINAGLRFDYYYTHFPEQVLGPGPLVPNRNITFAATDWYQWKNISPRLGAAYDLFGNGRTAIKGSASRFTLAVDPTTGNPYFNLANFVTRSWSDADRDYLPDCNLLDPQTNGECGTISDLRFGGLLPSTTTDPDTLQGWGKRPGNWQFSASASSTNWLPRVGIDVAYFRRSFFNFMVVQNRAVLPSDYPLQHHGAEGPTAARGRRLCRGRAVRPEPEQGGAVDNFVTFADNLGGQSESLQRHGLHDQRAPARRRPAAGRRQHGPFSDRQLQHRPAVRNSVTAYTAIPSNTNPIGAVQSIDMCHLSTGFLTQVKLLGTYGCRRWT